MCKHILMVAIIVVAGVESALAHESEPTYNRVSLSVSVEREVENDILIAVLFAEHQAQRQQTVSREVNKAIRWALDESKQRDGIKVQTTHYNTSPVYTKKVISGWRARQSIRLESSDPEQLGELIGELQERLSIESVNYAVSKAARDVVEESLTTDALAQYRRRAELITHNLGRKSYRIVQLNINTQGGVRPRQMAYANRGMMATEAGAAPAIEAGVQKITVSITGAINVSYSIGNCC